MGRFIDILKFILIKFRVKQRLGNGGIKRGERNTGFPDWTVLFDIKAGGCYPVLGGG